MSDIETGVQQTLIPMLNDKVVVIDAVQQHALAKWATLLVLMGQHGHPPGMRAIPPESYHRFYRDRALPRGAQIWTGRYSGEGPWPTDYHHLELFFSAPPAVPEPPGPNGYAAAFSVGNVAFLYFGHEIEHGPVLDIGRDLGRFFLRFWPVTAPIIWPPPGVLGADGVEASIRKLPFGL